MFCMGVTLGMHTFEPTKEGIMEFCEYFNINPECQDLLLFKPQTDFDFDIFEYKMTDGSCFFLGPN